MTNQQLNSKRIALSGMLGQLIDLDKGFLKEIITTRGEYSKLLQEIISNAISDIDSELEEIINREKE